jgi:hypothetical protein
MINTKASRSPLRAELAGLESGKLQRVFTNCQAAIILIKSDEVEGHCERFLKKQQAVRGERVCEWIVGQGTPSCCDVVIWCIKK